MSSDSDDIDEDELLQIALKEQAHRDLNYPQNQRKPVANYVQPPTQRPAQRSGSSSSSTVAGQKNASQAQQKGGRRGSSSARVEEDDDSEVEMLSISSGDEESSKDRVVGGKAGRGGARGSRGRNESKGEKDWDGEEADCWKSVDEDELARRVREMRETKSVPVVPKIERKASAALGRNVLNSLQSFPRGMECIDPLGLGIIDNRSLRLITDKLESSPSKADRETVDSDLRDKLLYFSEKFDPKLFLSRIHRDTAAADLEAGAHALKSDLQGRTLQRKQLVKENFDCFVSCKTTIDDIESKLKRIEDDPEGSGTSHLFSIIQGVSLQANRAFDPLFERQAQAEKIRSVQGMLQRFRTLFNLPSTIRGSISKGEYDLAVREYRKAKSIALPSHVGILKRVLEEVEKVMHEFKGMLYKSIEDPQIGLTEVENIVRLLLELEPESDPVWHYLNTQNHRIRGLLEKCSLDHEARMETLQNEIRERALSDAKWRKIQLQSNEASDDGFPNTHGDANRLEESQPIDVNSEEFDALRGKYIRRLTAVLIHHIPAFWKVALSVFSGKFAKSSQVSADANANTNAKSDEKVTDGRYSSHSIDEVAGMIRNTISAYEVKVQNTFSDFEDSNILCSYMSDAIKEIFKACQTFEAKESAPPAAVTALRIIHSEIIKIYILRLCSWMRSCTEDISKNETWIPVSILERNRSPYTISSLPLAFRSILASTMDHINLMIQSLRSEASKLDDIYLLLKETQESVRLAFLNCFLDFAGHLEGIANQVSQTGANMEDSLMQNGYSSETLEGSPDVLAGSVVASHQKMLMVLSNIGYCKDELSYTMYNKYKHLWKSRNRTEDDSDIHDLVMSFSGLEEKVLEQYTSSKASVIRNAVVNYLLDSGINWGGAPAVKGVRDAAVELLHTLVAVHAEVFAGAKPLLDKTLGVLVEALIDTFLSIFSEQENKDLRSLDANGFCQLMLELEYFETILNPYFTPDARESLKSLQGLLLEKAIESVSEFAENPGHARKATRVGEDAFADERQGAVSPDDLIALAQQYSSDLLQTELERTRVNAACFMESTPLDTVPESAKAAYASFNGPLDSPSRSYRSQQSIGSPVHNQRRRR
ncbi:hypothetical protein QQ045_017635 [Rhodiola kirilowii]